MCFAFLLLVNQLVAQDVPPRPDKYTPVTDLADFLTATEERALWDTLVRYEKSKQQQLIVVTVPTLNSMTINEFATSLYSSWRIGIEGRGALLLITKKERKMRIEVGYGLEADLTDVFCNSVIQETLVPNFKQKNYFIGIQSAVFQLMAQASQSTDISTDVPLVNEYNESPQSDGDSVAGAVIATIVIIFILLFIWVIWSSSRKPKSNQRGTTRTYSGGNGGNTTVNNNTFIGGIIDPTTSYSDYSDYSDKSSYSDYSDYSDSSYSDSSSYSDYSDSSWGGGDSGGGGASGDW